jgi:hypothetical protein
VHYDLQAQRFDRVPYARESAMPFRTWVPLGVLVAILAYGFLLSRKHGRRLLTLRDRPRGTTWVFAAAWAALWFVSDVAVGWLPHRLGPLLFAAVVLGIPVLLVALLLLSPPAGGWISLHEKGVLLSEGRGRPRFVAWDEIDRVEWNGDALLFHRARPLLGDSAGTMGFEVPADRRSEVESIIATHLRTGRA